MRRHTLGARVAGFMFAFAGICACNGQVLSFGASQSNGLAGGYSGDAGDASAPPPPAGTIASLTDDQAKQLCNWLYATFPAGAPSSTTPALLTPGYANSASFGHPATGGFGPAPLVWVDLPPDYCVMNLRHSPCLGTTTALEACANFFVRWYQSDLMASDAQPGITPADALQACTAFVDAPSCDETVFQHSARATADWVDCTSSLPIDPGAMCPPADAGDAAAE